MAPWSKHHNWWINFRGVTQKWENCKPAQSAPAVDVPHDNGDQPVPNGNEPVSNNNQPASEHQILTGNEALQQQLEVWNYGATFVLGDLTVLGEQLMLISEQAQEPDRNGWNDLNDPN